MLYATKRTKAYIFEREDTLETRWLPILMRRKACSLTRFGKCEGPIEAPSRRQVCALVPKTEGASFLTELPRVGLGSKLAVQGR